MVNNVDVVIGAGGGCGKLCVEQLVEAGGRVRAVGRVSHATMHLAPARLARVSHRCSFISLSIVFTLYCMLMWR